MTAAAAPSPGPGSQQPGPASQQPGPAARRAGPEARAVGLAARQAELVAALVGGGDVPAGFDAHRVGAAAAALRRKRAGEVARVWPLLAASLGPRWPELFGAWAAGREPAGSFLDGWAFARAQRAAGTLPALAIGELAAVEAGWVLRDGVARRRRAPAVRRGGGLVVFQVGGRLFRFGR